MLFDCVSRVCASSCDFREAINWFPLFSAVAGFGSGISTGLPAGLGRCRRTLGSAHSPFTCRCRASQWKEGDADVSVNCCFAGARRVCIVRSAFRLSGLCPAEPAVPAGAADLLSAGSGGPAGLSRDHGCGTRAASALTASKQSSGR